MRGGDQSPTYSVKKYLYTIYVAWTLFTEHTGPWSFGGKYYDTQTTNKKFSTEWLCTIEDSYDNTNLYFTLGLLPIIGYFIYKHAEIWEYICFSARGMLTLYLVARGGGYFFCWTDECLVFSYCWHNFSCPAVLNGRSLGCGWIFSIHIVMLWSGVKYFYYYVTA